MSELTRLTLAAARDGLARGQFTASELTAAHLDAMADASGLNAFITETPERARAMAADSDARLARGEARPLEGLPLAIKDLFCTRDVPTTAASRILENFIPPYESTVTAKLWDAGAVLLGKTNLDEFAMGSSCENSALGVTRNPYDLARVPGGSSGGSAAAVAAREAAIGLGSDTGGSIREPGAFCNLIGFKPTYGRISRYGLIAFASSLDQIGPLARTVEDAALAYDAMGGYDPMDATSIDRPLEPAAPSLRTDLRGLRIGLVREFDTKALGADLDAVYRRAYDELAKLGAEIVDVSLPTADYGLATYYLIAPAECSSNLSRFDGVRYGLRVDAPDVQSMYEKTRAAGFGPEVKRRILIGTYALSSGYYDAYYVRAQKARTLIARDFDNAFAGCDLIACPAASTPAFRFNAKSDPYSMYMMDYYTIPMSLAGLPALSVPCGWVTPADGTDPLPLGLQLCAPLFAEPLLLGAAHAYERATAYAQRFAPLTAKAGA